MTDDTKWTLASIYVYFESRLAALQELKAHDLAALNARFQDARDALTLAINGVTEGNRLAAEATEKRFDNVNEFRRALSDQTLSFVPRAEVSASFAGMQRELETIKVEQSRLATIGESVDRQSAVDRAQLEQRLHTMNEFRDQLTMQAGTFATKSEVGISFSAVDQRLNVNRDRLGEMMPRIELRTNWDRADASIAKVDERLKLLETGASNMAGKMWMLGAAITAVNLALTWYFGIHRL